MVRQVFNLLKREKTMEQGEKIEPFLLNKKRERKKTDVRKGGTARPHIIRWFAVILLFSSHLLFLSFPIGFSYGPFLAPRP